MGNKRIPFEPNCIYHVYNHGNAEDLLFRENKNYAFFLKRYRKYIPAIADTYAYCLMPNHFHLMVRIKSKEELNSFFKKKYPKRDPQSFGNFADLISNQFKNFLISYAKAFNKMYDRRGSLFLDNLNRNKIEDDQYFIQLVRYIHLNPVKHGFVDEPKQWSHSSYTSYLSHKPTLLKRDEVLGWFGGKENFIVSHKVNPEDL
jgi:REP element-mobilizing transposase RayT